MLGQMLLEQDALDKKQIGLFAVKRNQQILGTNQYAIQNNLMSGAAEGGKVTESLDDKG